MQVQVGIMASYALAVAWLSDFVLTPALCASVRITAACAAMAAPTRMLRSESHALGVSEVIATSSGLGGAPRGRRMQAPNPDRHLGRR